MIQFLFLRLYLVPALFLVVFRCQQNKKRTVLDFGDVASCPELILPLSRYCRGPMLSCRGRCGSILDTNGTRPQHACSCDTWCQVYGDCCWDYHSTCGHTPDDDKWKAFYDSSIVCWENKALVSGCPGEDGDTRLDVDDINRDYREAIVSEASTGLHFVNKRVYDLCNTAPRRLRNMTRWTQIFQKLGIEDVLPDLRDFFLTGNASENVKLSLYDVPPEAVRPRPCYGYTQINCQIQNPECDFFEEVPDFTLGLMCRYFHQESVNSLSSTTQGSVVTKVDNLTLPTPETTSVESTLTSVHPTLKSSTGASIVDNSYFLDWYPTRGTIQRTDEIGHNADECFAYSTIRDYRNDKLFDFSLLVDFNDDNSVRQITFQGQDNWEQLYCPEYLWTRADASNCQLRRKCKSGYISFESECWKPTKLTVLAERNTEEGAKAIVGEVLDELRKLHLNIILLLSSNETYSTDSGGFAYAVSFDLLEYSLEHTGAPGLDLVKRLVTSLRQSWEGNRLGVCGNHSTSPSVVCQRHMNGSHVLDLAMNVTVCLSAPIIARYEVCDAVLSNGVLASSEIHEWNSNEETIPVSAHGGSPLTRPNFIFITSILVAWLILL